MFFLIGSSNLQAQLDEAIKAHGGIESIFLKIMKDERYMDLSKIQLLIKVDRFVIKQNNAKKKRASFLKDYTEEKQEVKFGWETNVERDAEK